VPGNIDPIYSKAADIQWTTIPTGTTANTAGDGTGTVFTVFTADATNGGFVQSIRVKAQTTSAQTVIRFFINNGASNTVATNNSFFDEMTIPLVGSNPTAAVPVFDLPIGRALPAGYKINCCYGTSVTGAIALTAFAGKY
jgi:hypothetical protein